MSGSEANRKAVGKGQSACPQKVLQLRGRQLPAAGQRRRNKMRAAHFPVRRLLQLFSKSGAAGRKRTVWGHFTA